MGFSATFSKHFDHPPPFDVPEGVTDQETLAASDPSLVTDALFESGGSELLTGMPAGSFFCAAIRGVPPTVSFYLMLVDGERYFYFHDQVRDSFNPNASPEACHAVLKKMYGVFTKRSETSFKMVYELGKLTVNGKTLGG